MKSTLRIETREPVVMLADGIVYQQRKDWCKATYRPLQLSLLWPRRYYPYDQVRQPWPVVVWLCGGAFTEVDRNVWAPELAYFAKRGYVIASVEYSVSTRTRFPEQIQEVKQAIRFLRAHAEEFDIDPGNIAIMGESAGGYLAALAGVTGETAEFDTGDYLDFSSAVRAVVPWYGFTGILPDVGPDVPPEMLAKVPENLRRLAHVTDYITPRTPPFLLLHGDSDSQVPHTESERLHDELVKNGVPADLYIIPGADHGDAPFVQTAVKDLVLSFLDRHLEH